ncbi:phage/plasmid primase, P4 family [Gemmatimonadota bacterium]
MSKKASSVLDYGLIEKGQFSYLNDTGCGLVFNNRHGERVLYCEGKWYIWTDRRWYLDKERKICKLARDTAINFEEELQKVKHPNSQEGVRKHAKKILSAGYQERMLKMAAIDAAIEPGKFDTDPYLLNVWNGTLDLENGTLYQHDKDDLNTKIMKVKYKSDAECPQFIKFLARIMNRDRQKIAYLQRIMGYILTGDIKGQVFFIFWGPGANGKTTFMEVMRALLGDYSIQAEYRSFVAGSFKNAIRNDLAALKGSRLVVASEAETSHKLNETLMKQVSGGEALFTRFLFKEYHEYRPTFKIVLVTNNLPKIQERTEAIWRRIKLVPFNVTIPAEERNPNLLDDLKEELPGILNWALTGCLKWQKQGLNEPSSILQLTERYIDKCDPLGRFFRDCCECDSQYKVHTSDLQNAYKGWCRENGEFEVGSHVVANRLREFGCKNSTSNGKRLWKGIRLRER